MLLVLGIVLLLLLPSPWAVIGFAVCLVLGVVELLFWRRRVRDVPQGAGPELLIGKEARVVTACRPLGQVEIGGELWSARCEAGADPGEVVIVAEREGLELRVQAASERAGRGE
jgi:membrane protein implicated in regulation of membrane protease activity